MSDIALDTVESLLKKLEHRDNIIAAQRKVIEKLKEELQHGKQQPYDGREEGLAVSPDAWRHVQSS